MSFDVFDNYECEGQMTIDDLFALEIPESVFAVSKIFARARKQMSLAELKAFTYALTHIKFTGEKNSNKLMLDKKTLAAIIGITSDSDHLSQDLKRSIGKLPQNSFIEIDDLDNDFYESGVLITSLRMYKNNACITFNPDYMPLFENLQRDYITMWSSDIYGMSSERSIAFYEDLRLHTDTSQDVCTRGYGIKALKELFNMPKEGKGSYMRDAKNGGFNREMFEKKVIDPLCDDLAKTKMINLVMQPDGKYYEKVKENGRVRGYRFFWTYSSAPRVASAHEVAQISERIDKNPELLKVAKDILAGEKKPKKNSQTDFPQRKYDTVELEKELLQYTGRTN